MTDLALITRAIAASEHRDKPQSKHGWQQHVLSVTPKPPVLTVAGYQKRTPAEQAKYDMARVRFHQGLVQIETDQMLRAYEAMDQTLSVLTAHSPVARPGLILSGQANAGKSTILTSWGRRVELQLRDALGLPLDPELGIPPRLGNNAEYLPVAYFNLAGAVGSTLRNALRFYLPSIPITGKITIDSQLAQLADLVQQCRTSVILMDQVHEIRQATRGPAEVSEAIKQIMDTCPSTVVIGAGIGVEHLKIFSDGNSVGDAKLGQTGGRFALHTVLAYDRYDQDSLNAWLRLIGTVERELILLKGQPGDLLKLSEYILDRTGGLTGAAMKLLRNGANIAIASGEERITRKVLDRVDVSAFADLDSGHVKSTVRGNAAEPRRRPAAKARAKASHIVSSEGAVA